MGAVHPLAWHLGVQEPGALGGVIDVPARHRRQIGQPPIDHQHLGRLVHGQVDRIVQQVLVGNDLAPSHAGVGTDDGNRFGVVDAAGQ
ncbi:hypothetical protein SDC9_179169 [bioreactor metagenome]|uniref:Uncharacterized protein n=1 Tax=bioreactor metagenome TaxID=1076179 RepID=A0A645GY07_9ZZZZ